MIAPRPVRVVYCESNVDGTIGGSYYSLLYLVKGLDKRRYQPLVIFHSEHNLLRRFHESGVETLVWPPVARFAFAENSKTSWRLIRGLLQLTQKVATLAGFAWQAMVRALFLRRLGARLVHLNNSVLRNHEWMLAARLAGIHCVSHERGINDYYPKPARFFAKRLDAVLCISEAVRAQLKAHGLDYGNIVTVHNAFDPAEATVNVAASDLRIAHGIDAAAPVLVMAGNLKRWKGQETVIRAMAQVSRVHPAARCAFVGAPADQRFETAMRSLVAELGLEEQVVFLGYHENVADYMRMADVVLHASILPEPFGRVALEAMACGKPVIGSDAGGIPEIVEHGRTGLMFPPGDVDRLAEAIVWMLDHPAEAARMGERGYARLIECFPISANVRATEHLYDRVLKTRNGSNQSQEARI